MPMTEPKTFPRKITIPTRALPVVRALYAQMRKMGVTYDQLAAESKVKRSTFVAWRRLNSVTPCNLQATLRVVKLHALPIPRPDVLPAKLLAELHAIGERHGVPLPIAELAMVAAARGGAPC